MLAAYCFYTLLVKVGLGFVLSGLIAVAGVTLFSVLCYRLVIEPVREHESAVLIATIALALIFQELMPTPSAAISWACPPRWRARCAFSASPSRTSAC